jgi:NADP-dependent 3-hydroxy acid dehydrogenase YdfG
VPLPRTQPAAACNVAALLLQDAITMFQTNVLSVIAITKACVQGMIKRCRGHIINISSVAGHEAYSGG